jgi:hypothetical protein
MIQGPVEISFMIPHKYAADEFVAVTHHDN